MNREKLLSRIIEKWPAKVISLIIALIIAVFYRMNTLDTRTFITPLRVIENENFIPVGSFTDNVRISLRGETSGIFPILEDDIIAYIDLGKYSKEGAVKAPVQIRKKGSALGVEPLEISVLPSDISVLLEQNVTRNIPVYPVFLGIIASGYEMTAQSINPGSITAKGPRTVIESHHGFITEAININGRFENLSGFISIKNDNPLIKIFGNMMIEYQCTIQKIVIEKPAENLIPAFDDEEEEQND